MLRIQLSTFGVANSFFLLVLLLASLLLVLFLPEIAGDEGIKLAIGDLVLTIETSGKGDLARENGCASGQNSNSCLEMSDELTDLLGKNGIASEEIVIKALLDTNLSTYGVLEGTDGEGKGWEALVNLSEESAGLLELQVVLSIEFTFVDGCAELALLGLTLTGGHINVKSNDIAGGEFKLLNTLLGCLFIDDDIVTVDKVLLELVRQNALKRVNSV